MGNQNFLQNYGIVYKIKPTVKQKEIIEKNSGCSRFIYNQFLEKSLNEYNRLRDEAALINDTSGTNYSVKDLVKQGRIHYSESKEVTSFYDEYNFLYEKDIDSLALANSLQNFKRATKEFFKDLSKPYGATKKGYPNFKRKGYKISYQTNIQGKKQETFLDNKKYVMLPKLGKVKVNIHSKAIGKIKTVTVIRDELDDYYISCQVENHFYKKPKKYKRRKDNGNVLGLDVGITAAIITSSGDKIAHKVTSKELKYYDKKVARYQKMMARRKFGSKNYHKARKKKTKNQKKIANKIKDSNHKTVNEVLSLSNHFNIENLQTKKMKEGRGNAHSLQHRGLSSMLTILEYKAESQGKTVKRVGSYFPSTQLCSKCGWQNSKLKNNCSIREWTCPNCGAKHDRDINAAVNIKNYKFE